MRKSVGTILRPLQAGIAAAIAVMLAALAGPASAAEPLKIGFGMALTGGLAGTGKAALLATKMWAEDVNAKGGILGREIQLVHYDDQSNPSTVPGIYAKLLDIDKVDLVASGYATNMIAPAMPMVIERGLVFIGLFGLAINDQFRYERYFAIVPGGDDPRLTYSEGFFDVAMTMEPRPETAAIVGADAEYAQIATDGARENAQKRGLKIVYDRKYPPASVDFVPIVRAIQAANPDVVYIASYPPDTVGMVRAADEVALRPKMLGGGMIGLQYAAIKQQLGPLLNGITSFDVYVPEPTMRFAGIEEFLGKYQNLARAEGTDQLGFYTPPYAYARMQVLAQAIEATKSLDQKQLAQYLHEATFDTLVGKVKFGPSGEQAVPRILFVQYQGIAGNDIEQFNKPGKQVIVSPPAFVSGKFLYPYADLRR
jgi:branched-chain amino acid transport system substrate-binding protein